MPLTSLADDVAAADHVLERVDGPVVLAGHAYGGTARPHGLVWLPRDAFADAFAPNASSAEQEVLAAVQRPIAATSMGALIHRPLWKDRPSWFLIAEQDRMIAPETHRFTAERMGARARPRPSTTRHWSPRPRKSSTKSSTPRVKWKRPHEQPACARHVSRS